MKLYKFENIKLKPLLMLAHDEQDGTVAPHGYKDARDWLVVVESDLLVIGGPTYLVNRRTGKLHLESYVDNIERFEAMKSTGGRTFRAECAEGVVEWHKLAPHVVGTPALVERVEDMSTTQTRRSPLCSGDGLEITAHRGQSSAARSRRSAGSTLFTKVCIRSWGLS